MGSFFEMMMLIAFGFAWPINIYKSLKSTSVEGKSVIFLYVIVLGYLCGIINKIFYNYDYVLYFYILNTLMVSTDIALYYRTKHKYKK